MPTPLQVRRQRGFRPISYTSRHRLVTTLRALGQKRSHVARCVGYSPSHVSRITGMAEALEFAERVERLSTQALIDRVLTQLTNAERGAATR